MDILTWNELISNFPGSHILQTREWGEVKSKFGWSPIHALWFEKADGQYLLTFEKPEDGAALRAAALILKRTIKIREFSTGLTVLYVPRGPLLLSWDNLDLRRRVLDDLNIIAKNERAIFIKIDPEIRIGTGVPGQSGEGKAQGSESILDDIRSRGWRYSDDQIQFANTMVIDLSQSEDALLARMKPKTRYNVRLAERKGVNIRLGSMADMDILYQLYAETSLRDGFVIRSIEYYQALWSAFLTAGMARILMAEVDGQPIAALILFIFQRKAWYLYGMSREAYRERMPNYLLQWEAIRQCKQAGCLEYDLWGAPYQFVESDPLWGVYRFKDGLGGQVVRYIGAWDLPVKSTGYMLFTRVLPRILEKMRVRGIAKTQHSLSEQQ
jgi:lipid II:glycine glycyltransferase (peptidoglycan interpeptide bridge formation enzyme)